MASKSQAGTIAAELEELSTKVGMLGQAFNVRTTTGRRFAHVHAARIQQQKRVEQLKKEVASTEVAESAKQDAKMRQAMRGGERVVASSLLVPIVHKFDRGQAALRYRRKVAPRILIVDDNRIHGAAALLTFRKAFEDVFFAANGRQALEIMEHQAIDVVFMDAVMPVMDGAETTDIIRYTEESAGGRDFRTLIIGMVTSEQATDSNIMDDLFLAGMDRYVVKPLSTHLKAVSSILCVDGASVEGFRRKALEQHWVSHHDDLRVVLQGSEEERRRREEIVSVTDAEVRKEKHVISNFRDDDKFSIEDLFARQRREDMARMQLNAARMRDRIRELEHELADAKAVCKQLTENKHSDQILALERKRDAVTAELDMAQLQNATLAEQNKTLSIDLKNLLSNGFANEKKVRAAERRSARLHHKMARTEARMLQMEDRQALNAWGNYYGRLENRENRWAPPAFATNVAGSWYAGLLERVEALATDTGKRCAQSLDTVGSMMQRAQLPSATVEGLRDDVIQTLQGHIDHVDGLTSVHAEQMRDFVAQFIVREAKFWKMAQADDPSLPRELRELVQRHDERAREHLSNSEGCQTDFADVEAPSFDGLDPNSPIGGGGGDAAYASSTFLTATTTGAGNSGSVVGPSSGGSSNAGSKAGTPEPDLNVLPVLERLSSIVNEDSFVPTHIRRATMEQALRIARGIEERRYTELLRAVQELRKEVGEALSKIEDPAAKGIKLQPVLSSIRPHTFNEIKNAILDICDNVSTIVSVAADSVPKGKPGLRRGAAGGAAAAGSRGTASRIANAAAAKTAAQNIRSRGSGAKKDAPASKSGSRGGGDDSDTSMGRNRQGRNKSNERQPGLTRSRTTAAPFSKELTRDARSRAKLAPAGTSSGRSSKGPTARNAARPAIKAVNNEAAERLIKRQNDRAQSLAANARGVHRSPSPGMAGRSTSPANRATGESEAFTRAAVLAHATAAAIESALNHTTQVGPVLLDSATVSGFTIANLARISRTTEELIREANRDRPLPEFAGDVIDGDAPLFLPIGADLLADAVEDARAGNGGHDDGAATAANDDTDLAQDDDGRILTLADVLEDRLEMVRRVPSGAGSFEDSNRSAVTSPPALTAMNDDGTTTSARRSLATSKANTPVGKASPSTVKGKQVLGGASKSLRRVANVAADAEATVSHQVVEPTTIAELARLFGANVNDIIGANDEYFREVFGETPEPDAELDAGDRVKVPVTAQALRRNIMHSREGQRQTGGSFIPSRGTTPANEPSPRASHIAPVALDYAVAAALEQKTPVILVKHFVARIPASGDADDDAADMLPSAMDIARMYDVSEADVEKANPFAFKGPEKLAVEGMTLSVPVASTHVASMLEEEKEALHEKLAGLTAEVAILEAAERDEDAAEARAELDAGRAVVARHRAAIAVLQNIERTNNAKDAAVGRPRGSSVTTSPSARKASTPGSGPVSTKQGGRTTSPLTQLPNVVSGDDLAGSMEGSVNSFSTSTSPQARAGQRDRSRTFNASGAGGGRLQHSNTMSYAPRTSGSKGLMPGAPTNAGGTASRRGSQLPPTGLPNRLSNSKQGSRSGSRVRSPDAPESQPPTQRKGTIAGAALATGTTTVAGAGSGSGAGDGDGESHGVVISVRSADDDSTSRPGSAGDMHVPPSAILALHDADHHQHQDRSNASPTTTAGERAAMMMASVNLTGVDEMPMLDSGPGTCVDDGTGKPTFGSRPASTEVTSPRATTPRDAAAGGSRASATPTTDGHGFTAPELDVGSNHDGSNVAAQNELTTPTPSFSARHALAQTAAPRPMGLPTSPVSNGHDDFDNDNDGAGNGASPREQSLTAVGGATSESASPMAAAVQPPRSETATSDAAVQRILAEADKDVGGDVDRWSPVQHAYVAGARAPQPKKGGRKAAPPPVVATKRPAPARKTAVLAKTVTAEEPAPAAKAPPSAPVAAAEEEPQAPPQPMIVSFGTAKLPGGHQKTAFEPSPLRAALATPGATGKRRPGADGPPTSRGGSSSPAAPNPASVTAFAAAMASQGVSKQHSPRTAQQQQQPESGRRTASSSVPPATSAGLGVAANGVRAEGGGGFSIVGSGAQRAGPDILGAPSVAARATGGALGGEAKPNKGAAREAARIFGVKKDEMPGSKAASRAGSRTGSPIDAAAGSFAAAVPPVTGNKVDAPNEGTLALVMGSSSNRRSTGGPAAALPPVQGAVRGGAPSSPLSKAGAAMPQPTLKADDELPLGLVAVPIRKAHQLASLDHGGGTGSRGPSPGRSHGVRSPTATNGPATNVPPLVTAMATSDPLSTVRLDPALAPPPKPLVPRPPPFGDADLQPGSPRPPGPSGEVVARRRAASPPVPVGTRRVSPPHGPHPESARRAPVTEPPKQGRESPKRASLNLPVKRVDWKQRFTKQEPRTSTRRLGGATPHRAGPPPRRAPGAAAGTAPVVDKDHLKSMFDRVALNGK